MTPSVREQSIFKKVAMSEKKALFRDLAKENVLILLRPLEGDETFQLVAIQNEKDEILYCDSKAGSEELAGDQKVICSFNFQNERYYFNTDLAILNGRKALKINVDLFQLQRRASARLEIPDAYEALFVVAQHVGKPCFVDCRVKDISAGGMKLEFVGETPNLNLGDRLHGTLKLGRRRPIDFEVEVRFAKKATEGDHVIQTAGVQFLKRGQSTENRLLWMMMDLQRELYLKYPSS